ncbi:MAG: YHYH protein [Bermanella sp.]
MPSSKHLLPPFMIISSLLLGACGGSSSTTTTTASGDATDITDVNLTARDGSCSDYVGSYESSVTDVQNSVSFMGDFTISVSGSTCTLASNDIPNHNFNDATADFATNVAEVAKSYTMPTSPTAAASTTELALGTTNAILLNGVVLDILPAACYDVGDEPLGQEKIGCGGDQIDNPWRYDPMSSLNGFGTDIHNAHVQPDGTYHYHGNPVALFAQDCTTATTTSPVIGFAADGFPVFGSCIDDGNDGVRQVTSSYALKSGVRQAVSSYTTPAGGTGDVASDNYDGQFRGDYEYTASSGDLDECNGMTVDGQYGYFATSTFPWMINCYKGTVQSSFSARNAQELEVMMHGHSH